MPRYTKQRDCYSCSPIGILNAMRWAGKDAPYDPFFTKLSKTCKTLPLYGTGRSDFVNTLKKFGSKLFKIQPVKKPKASHIRKHLANGGAVLMSYRTPVGRHMILLINVSNDNDWIKVVNDSGPGPAACWYSRFAFNYSILRYCRVDPLFKAWFLTKKE